MPYCCQCGKPTQDADVFCGACGTRQAPAGAQAAAAGISPRGASILCYIPIVGWIPAIIALASQKFRGNRDVRFHAFQGIYVFVAWLVVDWVIGPVHRFPFWPGAGHWQFSAIGGILKAILFFAWIFMLIKTSQGETYKLPLLGELAERSVEEQKG